MLIMYQQYKRGEPNAKFIYYYKFNNLVTWCNNRYNILINISNNNNYYDDTIQRGVQMLIQDIKELIELDNDIKRLKDDKLVGLLYLYKNNRKRRIENTLEIMK